MNFSNNDIAKSIECLDGPKHKIENLRKYLIGLQENNDFDVNLIGISKTKGWNFDKELNFVHETNKFFSLRRVKYDGINNGILNQPDSGILALLITNIEGVLHFLVQFKEEPGNINKVQLSPTIQATKSNSTKAHGGTSPPYWNEFSSISLDNYLIDSFQPEQGLRYWQKYNRNLVIISDYLEEKEGFKWMTLGQIFEFTKIDNSINSCLRSVLSLFPYSGKNSEVGTLTNNLKSLITSNIEKNKGYGAIHDNVQSFYSEETDSLEFKTDADSFLVKGLQIKIKNREVSSWHQPIIVESNKISYILIRFYIDDRLYYGWSAYKEPGYFYGFILGPSKKLTSEEIKGNSISDWVGENFGTYGNISKITEITMSEEGGRFWQFEVPHVIVDLDLNDIKSYPANIILLDEQDSLSLIESGFLSMEGRSIFTLSKSVKK